MFNTLRIFTFAALILTTGMAMAGAKDIKKSDSHSDKKTIVYQSFQDWQNGTGSPFSLLIDDFRWTISGFNKYAGTYDRKTFNERLIVPFSARIAAPLKPTKWKVYEDGDTVIIHFDAETRLKNGKEYSNSYAWFFTFDGDQVTEVTAFLDMPAFEVLIDTPLP